LTFAAPSAHNPKVTALTKHAMGEFKDLLVKLRKAEGLSQEELAQKLGFSRPTLVAIEKGDRDVTLGELRQISTIFDLPFQVMMDDDLELPKKVEARNAGERSYLKFRDLILQCIKYGSGSDGKITKTKLAKLVYLADFAAYYKWLEPISGFQYHRLAKGPVAIEFFHIIDDEEAVSVENKGNAILVASVQPPEGSVLSKKELELVRTICKKWKNASTQEIVDFTHKQFPWKICRDREVIPYSLINNEDPENVY